MKITLSELKQIIRQEVKTSRSSLKENLNFEMLPVSVANTIDLTNENVKEMMDIEPLIDLIEAGSHSNINKVRLVLLPATFNSRKKHFTIKNGMYNHDVVFHVENSDTLRDWR